jgi:hypothetical protein
MARRFVVLFFILAALWGCFATRSAPIVVQVSDLAPSAAGGVSAREPAFAYVMDRFHDDRSNRSILGQYDLLGKGGFAGTRTVVADRDITEVFEGLVKKSFTRKGVLQGPSPFILKGSVKKAGVDAAPDSETLRAEVFLELTLINTTNNAYIWRKSYLGSASGVDPKATLGNAFRDLAIAVDQDDSVLALRQLFIASGGRLPEIAAAPAAVQEIVSDVDELPARKAPPNRNAYAIVIGIEQYRQRLPRADFAAHDAQVVTEYLFKVLGYPQENIVTLLNDKASRSDFDKYIGRWLANNVGKNSTVFIYYSGHGAPNPVTGDAYLVPYDGDPAFIDETGYSLKALYEQLGRLPAREIIVALDACFSGAGGRSVIAKGARPLVMHAQGDLLIPGNVTVLAAAANNQVSSTYDSKSHGLFTYFMLKGIRDENVVAMNGSIAVGDLYNYLKPQVEVIARKQYNNTQSPQLLVRKRN